MANSFAICAPAGNSGKEEISACRIPWIRVYIYIYILSILFFERTRYEQRSTPIRGKVEVSRWNFWERGRENDGEALFLGIFIWDRSWHAEAGSNDVQFN